MSLGTLTLLDIAGKIALLVRIILGGLFAYAGILKITDIKGFAKTLSLYNLVPEQLLVVVAIMLPLLEIIAGIGLMFNVRFTLSLITGMLIVFIVVLWYGILNNLEIDCGCFSTEELASHDSLRQAFYRDLVMLVGTVYIYLYRFKRHGFNMPKLL